jgi:hypothetical protein
MMEMIGDGNGEVEIEKRRSGHIAEMAEKKGGEEKKEGAEMKGAEMRSAEKG